MDKRNQPTSHCTSKARSKITDKIDKAKTYVDAVVVEVRICMEFVRHVVLVSSQELTQQIIITVRRCYYIEGETRHNAKASESAV